MARALAAQPSAITTTTTWSNRGTWANAVVAMNAPIANATPARIPLKGWQ
jgi:hypothetical protein